jgi:hypothetical protein
LSTRPDFIRPSLIAELNKLHDQVSVAPFLDFEPVLADELSLDWKLLFMDMQTQTPLGAASLAQVNQATLWDGTPAVVKIQRPGVKAIVQQDMALLRRAARLMAKAAPRFNAVIDVEAMLSVVFDAMEPELDFVESGIAAGWPTSRSIRCCSGGVIGSPGRRMWARTGLGSGSVSGGLLAEGVVTVALVGGALVLAARGRPPIEALSR